MSTLQIYNKNSTLGLTELSDKSIDLICTSPPYWNLIDYKVENQLGYGQTYDKYLVDLYITFDSFLRVIKNNRMIVINVADIKNTVKFDNNEEIVTICSLQSDIINYFKNKRIPLFRHIIWYKPNCPSKARGSSYKKNMLPRYIFPQYNIEHILVFFVPDMNKEHISAKDNIKIKNNRINIKTATKWSSSLWEIPYESSKEHPAIFPEEIPFRLIKLYSFSGETVLDPFMGRGTTLKIGAALNRNVIGYELNTDYISDFTNNYLKAPIELKSFEYSQINSKQYLLNSSEANNSNTIFNLKLTSSDNNYCIQ